MCPVILTLVMGNFPNMCVCIGYNGCEFTRNQPANEGYVCVYEIIEVNYRLITMEFGVSLSTCYKQ